MLNAKFGVGFITGRKNFKKVLNTYLGNWEETKSIYNIPSIKLSLFVSYDTNYQNTQSSDYTNLSQGTIDSFEDTTFIGIKNIYKNIQKYVDRNVITEQEKQLLFSSGYAGKRNGILLSAIENDMDYLLFLDDDEYPMAVSKNKAHCSWTGQQVFWEHLRNIQNADITTGYHCGYISPIPQISFDNILTEELFKEFVKAISNDIVNWESIWDLMENGGVTYADSHILTQKEPFIVNEKNHCKFISGSNLCINLKQQESTFPFYNPPGARGEDTFLSTLLSDRKVLRIPNYTFHDGFSTCKTLLDGVLPVELKPITTSSDFVKKRFYKACIGWVRYKPLLMYLINQSTFKENVKSIKSIFKHVLPAICQYFDNNNFMNIETEFEKYSNDVHEHALMFQQAQSAWNKLMRSVKQ